MKNYYLAFLSIILFMMSSCGDDDTDPTMGELSISFSTGDDAFGRAENENVSSAIISLEDISGNLVISSESYDLISFEDGYLIDPILLEVGEYKITEFLILNDNDEVIYATPKSGSALEALVNTPLPIEITIFADEISSQVLEVIATEGIDPEDLGYASISFEIISTMDILISVLFAENSGHEFISADLTLFADGDSISTIALGDSINLYKVRTTYSEYEFKFTSSTYGTQSIVVDQDSLDYFRTRPMEVIFQGADLSEGLIAYYSFSGNAKDDSGNGLDGVLGDGFGSAEPAITADKDGTSSSAYSFNGVDSYIDLSESSDFDLANHEEFSVSTWINPADTTNGIIVSKYISASDNRMWLLRIWEGNIRFVALDGTSTSFDMLETPVQSGWQHIAVVLDNGVYRIYVNGTEMNSTSKTVDMLSTSPTAKTLIGAVHFSNKLFDRIFTGDIDEVRVYKRALSTTEIELLAE